LEIDFVNVTGKQFFQRSAFKYKTFSGIDERLGKPEQVMLVEAKKLD
jgi:hypothetical protein